LSVLESDAPTVLRGAQRPRLLHLPDGTEVTVNDALYLLGEWGMALDDWQQFVLRGSLRELPDGRWSAKEVGLEVPRQNGKGELLEARALIGLFLLDERVLIHSAHEFATAVEALDRMDDRIAQNPDLKRLCKPTKRSHGEEGIYRRDGRKLRYRTRTKGGGRGFTADWLALDEAMFVSETFHGTLMPTVSAVWNPQIWYTGSAVDQESMEHGVVFSRLRERA
jgi:phage terminase large subunit-like protein